MMGIFVLFEWVMLALLAKFLPENSIIALFERFYFYIMLGIGIVSFAATFRAVYYQTFREIVDGKTRFYLLGILAPRKTAETWIVALGWWIPRKYRAAIVGDILEDCHEMREKSCGECRIRIQVLWQWAIAIVTLVPAGVLAAVWRMVSPPK